RLRVLRKWKLQTILMRKHSRSTKEQNDSSVRPEIGSETVSLDGYTTIYIGYPIWWGEEPRIMDTFVESYSFDGITMA
ncbi:MAG: hypothetical protein K5851_03240, partial [Lachnospiraceae bacterium]|nr:hypothetical protein [Lachnospiraceae bacterium]